jgi:hypothetical protein
LTKISEIALEEATRQTLGARVGTDVENDVVRNVAGKSVGVGNDADYTLTRKSLSDLTNCPRKRTVLSQVKIKNNLRFTISDKTQ